MQRETAPKSLAASAQGDINKFNLGKHHMIATMGEALVGQRERGARRVRSGDVGADGAISIVTPRKRCGSLHWQSKHVH
jgi:hypothetical protein